MSIVRKFEDPWNRAETLLSLASLIEEQEKGTLLEEALAAARSASAVDTRAELLIRLIPSLPDAEQRMVLEEARSLALLDPSPLGMALNLENIALLFVQTGQVERAYSTVLAIPGYEIQVRALQKVAPNLPPASQQEAYEHALAVIWEVDEELDKQMDVYRSRSQVLAYLIPDLPESLAIQTLERVRRSSEDFDRFWPLAMLAASLPEPWKNQVATEALSELADYHETLWELAELPNYPHLVDRLVAVARHLSEPTKSQALADAYNAAQGEPDLWKQALGLIEVIPYLSEVQRMVAFEKVISLSQAFATHEILLLNPLAAAVTKMGDAASAATVIRSIPSELNQIRTLAELAPTLVDIAPMTVYSIWSEVLQAFSTQPRAELLKALPALRTILELLGDEQAGAEMTRAIQEVGKMWQ